MEHVNRDPIAMPERKQMLDHGYIDVVRFWGSEEEIVESARMSTGKGFKGWGVLEVCAPCGGKGTNQHMGQGPGSLCRTCWGGNRDEEGRSRCINTPGDEKLLKHLYTNKHMTPFEMAGATFEIQAPIFVFREWHRHRTQSYNEMSARYTPLPDVNYIPSVNRLLSRDLHGNKQAAAAAGAEQLTEFQAGLFRAHLEDFYRRAEDLYQSALKSGVPKELARLPVPVGRYSRMRASANLRNWMQFLTLRDDHHAQWEIRAYAAQVREMLAAAFPRTMALFEEGRKREEF